MTRVIVIFSAFLLASLSAKAAGVGWLERPPLNTDIQFVSSSIQFGLARAYRWLAMLIDLPVLAGLIYAFEQESADFSYFLYVFFAIDLGSFLFSVFLSPYLGVWSILPIMGFEFFLLSRFCLNSMRSVVLVVALYHLFQIGYLVAFRMMAGKY